RPCWPPSATSPTPPGGPPRSASTGCGETRASPSARCSLGSWPTWPVYGPQCGRSPRSPPPPAWSSQCACTRPTRRHGSHDGQPRNAAAVCDLPDVEVELVHLVAAPDHLVADCRVGVGKGRSAFSKSSC